jgi:hypothetical protein
MAEVIAIDQARIERDERKRPVPSLVWGQLEGSKRILRYQGIIKEHLKLIAELDRSEATKFVAQLAAELQP